MASSVHRLRHGLAGRHARVPVARAATTVAARVVQMEGKIGVVAPGAFADLLVVDGKPLDDIGILADPAAHLQLVMKAGQIHLDRR